MFKIECYCDDKKLAKALWAMTAIGVYNVTSVPVTNAKKTANGKLKPKIRQASLLAHFKEHLKQTKTQEVTPQLIKSWIEGQGRTSRNYSNVLRDAMKEGWLARIGHEYRYRVKLNTAVKKGGKK